MIENSNKVRGVYAVEKKYNLVWLTNANTKSSESVDYFKFSNLLTQAFTNRQRNVILEELNCMRKVILDFDKGVAKKVIDKDPNFMESMLPFFSPKYIQNQLDDPFNDSIDMYKPDESIKGGFSV